MRVLGKRACFAGDGRRVVPGEVIELDDRTARYLLAIRKVEVAPPEPEASKKAPPASRKKES